jgi:very-short-patch-repair endonuclease
MERFTGRNSQRQVTHKDRGALARNDRANDTFHVPVLGHWDLVPISGSRDRRVDAVAAQQRERLNRLQMRAAGITDSQVDTMLGNERLRARFRGVYVVGQAPAGELTRETEALLACPFGALLDGVSAAANWGVIPWRLAQGPVEVTTPGGHQSRRADIRLHRTSELDAKLDVRIRNGLPTVSPARALVAVAGSVTPRELERGLDDALNSHIVRLAQVREALIRLGRRHKGARILDALLSERESGSGVSRSDGELALSDALLASGLPRPERNVQLYDYEADFFWRELRVIVEVDSYEHHLRKSSFDSDRAKDAALEARGFTVLRFPARLILDEPIAVIARIAAVLTWASARIASLGTSGQSPSVEGALLSLGH